jgi:hypothetical protein
LAKLAGVICARDSDLIEAAAESGGRRRSGAYLIL